jgi:RNA polymerase sigma factor (sigma-70 family)
MNFGPSAGTLRAFSAFPGSAFPGSAFPATAVLDSSVADLNESNESNAFTRFVDEHGVRLRRVLTARYGVENGGDVYADALAWAWQHWDRLEPMDNPVGYLYRVAQSSSRPHRRWLQRNSFPARMPERWHLDEDSSLFQSLGSLTEAQRVSVLMVHGYNWSYGEVAEVLGCSVASVTNHVHRGLAALRRQLKEEE